MKKRYFKPVYLLQETEIHPDIGSEVCSRKVFDDLERANEAFDDRLQWEGITWTVEEGPSDSEILDYEGADDFASGSTVAVAAGTDEDGMDIVLELIRVEFHFEK
jgi:hypothetical protein